MRCSHLNRALYAHEIFNTEVSNLVSLVLNHPESQVKKKKKQPFSQTFKTGIGVGYYIPQTLMQRISIGDRVVILSDKKGSEERAEGVLSNFMQSGSTNHNPPRPRYDVCITGLKKVKYHRNDFGKLERSGVAVF